MVHRLLPALFALGLLGIIAGPPPSYAAALDKDAVNGAELSAGPDRAPPQDKKGRHRRDRDRRSARESGNADPAVIKAQILLDRANVSPGEIDGRLQENTKKALAAFAAAHQLESAGTLDGDVGAALAATSNDPVLVDYTITEADVKGPFLEKLPAKMEEMKDLDHLGYASPREALAEKFHMSENLLRELNPGKSFKAGESIVVAAVARDAPDAKVARIAVDKPGRALRAFDKDGRLLLFAPASIGSTEKPAPSGRFKVTSVAKNPTYRYNPAYAFKGVKSKRPFTIKPGPNNPVGAVWINLSLKGYGIHGTPDPGKVSKTESHGCIRLTNWDALKLAAMAEKGTVVDFLDRSENAPSVAATPTDAGSQAGGDKVPATVK